MNRIAFFGTPQFAADILSGILEYPEIEVVLVVSQPDMPVGRKQELLLTPVKQLALEKGIKVLQPESLKPSYNFLPKGEMRLQDVLKTLDLDFIVVVAYGKIIPKYILDIPKYGCINIHGSILPKYRGASPVQECLKNGDTQTGLTTMYMSQRMDEGDILQIAKIDIDIVDKAPDIFRKFVDIGPVLLHDTIQKIISGEIQGAPQNHPEASYCSKIEKEDGKIHFQTQSASEIYNLFRAYTPWPGIYTLYEGKRLMLEDIRPSSQPSPPKEKEQAMNEMQPSSPIKGDEIQRGGKIGQFLKIEKNLYGIVCADETILGILQVKPEGKKSMDIASFLNGNKGVLEYIFE